MIDRNRSSNDDLSAKMDEHASQQLADTINATPRYQARICRMWPTGWAVLVFDTGTKWERWIHSEAQWAQTEAPGFLEI
jgi:hypothetical protein